MNRKLARAFREQAIHCAALESPFMARLCDALAELTGPGTALGDKLNDWPGDIGPSHASLPLRLCGGLHALVLKGDPLRAVYPRHDPSEAELRDALLSALDRNSGFLIDWIGRPPQTNEVRRSAMLIAGTLVAAAAHPCPIHLSELGASAGLNLRFDRYALETGKFRRGPADPALILNPQWAGPPPPDAAVTIAARAGADLMPLDPAAPEDRLRLLAYLWPDQPKRRSLTEAALAVPGAKVVQADAIDWLEERLVSAPANHLHLVTHTVAWQYFPEQSQRRGEDLFAAHGARATAGRPLARLSVEADRTGRGAAMTLTLWPGPRHLALGRADFHGRWIDWSPMET